MNWQTFTRTNQLVTITVRHVSFTISATTDSNPTAVHKAGSEYGYGDHNWGTAIRLGVWGSIVSSPSGVRGGAPTASNFFVYTDKIWANFWPPMGKQRWANRDKSEKPSQKRDKWPSRENCWFLFPGHDVKNRDCLKKS